jgi:hypothetical protein
MADRHARAAHARWRHLDPRERAQATEAARLARLESELDVVDPDRELSSADLVAALTAHRRDRMTRLAQRSVAARQAKRLQVAA